MPPARLVVGEDLPDRLVAAPVAAEPLERRGDRLLDRAARRAPPPARAPRSEDESPTSRSGRRRHSTCSGPRPRAQIAATTPESIPPETATTAPRRPRPRTASAVCPGQALDVKPRGRTSGSGIAGWPRSTSSRPPAEVALHEAVGSRLPWQPSRALILTICPPCGACCARTCPVARATTGSWRASLLEHRWTDADPPSRVAEADGRWSASWARRRAACRPRRPAAVGVCASQLAVDPDHRSGAAGALLLRRLLSAAGPDLGRQRNRPRHPDLAAFGGAVDAAPRGRLDAGAPTGPLELGASSARSRASARPAPVRSGRRVSVPGRRSGASRSARSPR